MINLKEICGEIHVIPDNDIKKHIKSIICPCKPKIEKRLNADLIIHNSFDGRERIEDYIKTEGRYK